MTNGHIMNGSGNSATTTTTTTTAVDPAFQPIVRNKTAFLIWRVENMQLSPVPRDSYGVFFKADTYLIYNASETTTYKQISQHIHLWIGEDSTNDEQGVGAYKMVELDEYLGGAPIQHRECQACESERFLSYFKLRGGIKYVNGGVASGLNHYEKKFVPRLFQVKGKRNVRLLELNILDWSSLNRTDSFIVDLNTAVFVWNGKMCNRVERLQAVRKAKQMRDERGGLCNIVIVEDGEEKDLSKDELRVFEARFPLKDKMVKLRNDATTPANNDDLRFDREACSYLKLYRCSDAQDEEDGTVKIKIIEQKSGPLFKEDLNSEDSFIIDNGRAGIWVWIGKRSSPKDRQEAMRNALGFLQAKGFDERQQSSIKVTRVIEGAEPVEFRALFNRWPESFDSSSIKSSSRVNYSIAKTVQTYFDAALMHANPQLAADSQMLDDGKGLKEIWIAQKTDIMKLSEKEARFGHFFTAECYIIHYSYKVNSVEKHILYYWIGRKSSQEDQNIVTTKVVELDNKLLNSTGLLVRVIEGKEPVHFMSMFEGRIIIYQGGRGMISAQNLSHDSNYMLQVKSYGSLNIKAVQVDYRAGSLNSNNVFIVVNQTKGAVVAAGSSGYFIWCGKGSTGDEREAAKQIIYAQKKEPEIVIESQERDDFWLALGGRQAYNNEKNRIGSLNGSSATTTAPMARLFEGSYSNSGKLSVTEVYQFNQEDLNPSDVMILDTWDSIFIWIGQASNKVEKEEAEKMAIDYLKTDPSQRGIDLPIYKIKQGLEPPIFTGFFGAWDPTLWTTTSTKETTTMAADYFSIKSDLQSKNQPYLFDLVLKDKSILAGLGGQGSLKNKGSLKFNDYPKYTYDVLIRPADELPEDILAESKEVHLTNEDFNKIFKLTYEQFKEKPMWKQKELKRSVRLF